MCLIIVPEDPKGLLVVTEAQMEDALRHNNDGWGFMWAERGRVKQCRGFSLPVLNDAYEALALKPGLCLHFRMGTSGGRSLDNCHPHRISSDLAIMHNGIFRIDVEKGSGKSDTAVYADHLREYVSKYGVGGVHEAEFIKASEDWMGTGNKVVYLTADGRRSIANANVGVVRDGMWYSNTYAADFLRPRHSYIYSGSASRFDDDDWPGMYGSGGRRYWSRRSADKCEYCKAAVGKHECDECFGEYCDGCYDHGTKMCIKCLMDEAEREERIYGEAVGVVQGGKEEQRVEGVVLSIEGGLDRTSEYPGRPSAQSEHAAECRCVGCLK